MYQAVGAQLAKTAMGAPSESEMDAFGRSAFNRFYYSSYLEARDLLGRFNPAWRGQGHADVPNLLKDSAKGILLRAAKKARNVMTHVEIMKSLNLGISGLDELAQILKEAYAIRVLADYQPETKTIRIANKISLGSANLASAQYWPRRTRILTSAVFESGRSLGLF